MKKPPPPDHPITLERLQACRTYLFVTKGVPWTARQVSNNLFDMSTAYFSQGLGLADWRQLVAFVQDFFGVEQSIRQALSDPSVRMFMHSLGTHGTHYVLDEDRIRGHIIH